MAVVVEVLKALVAVAEVEARGSRPPVSLTPRRVVYFFHPPPSSHVRISSSLDVSATHSRRRVF